MNRAVAVALAAIIGVVGAIWFFQGRGDSDSERHMRSAHARSFSLESRAQRRIASQSPIRTRSFLEPEVGVTSRALQIVDAKAGPLVGAEVVHADEKLRAREDGMLKIPVTWNEMVVFHEGYVPLRLTNEDLLPPDQVTVVRLSRGVSLSGIVLDEFGAPVTNALVRVSHGFASSTEEGRLVHGVDVQTVHSAGSLRTYESRCATGDDGRFSFEGLLRAPHTVRVEKFGYTHAVRPGIISVTPPGDVDLHMARVYVGAIRFDSRCREQGREHSSELSYTYSQVSQLVELPIMSGCAKNAIAYMKSQTGDSSLHCLVYAARGSAIEKQGALVIPIEVSYPGHDRATESLTMVPLSLWRPKDALQLGPVACPGHATVRVRCALRVGLMAAGNSGFPRAYAPIRADQDWQIFDVPPGRYSVYPRPSGFLVERGQTPFVRPGNVEVRSGGSADIELDVAVEAKGRLRGVVVDGAGRPTDQFILRIRGRSTDIYQYGPLNGSTFSLLARMGTYRLVLMGPTGRPCSEDTVTLSLENPTCDLELVVSPTQKR